MHTPLGIHDVGVNNISMYQKKVNFAYATDYIQFIQSIVTFILNSIVFLLITSNSDLRKKISNQLFMNLQISHMLLSVLIIASELYPSTWEEFYVFVVIGNALLMEMFISLMICSGDRLFAINYPFVRRRVRRKHVSITLICSWIPVIVFTYASFAFHIMQHHMTIIMTIMIGSAALILTSSNIVVYLSAVKHDTFVEENTGRRSEGVEAGKKHLRASFVCLAVVFSFVLCWFPYFIHNTLTLRGIYTPGSQKPFTIFAEQFSLLNSLADPILFVFLSKDARRLVRTLCQLKVSRDPLGDNTTTDVMIALGELKVTVRITSPSPAGSLLSMEIT